MIGRAETRRTVDEDGGGGQLGGQSDDPRVPIVPANNRMTLVRMGLSCNGELRPAYPIAKAIAGSTNRPARVTWPPGTGRRVVNSPKHNMTATQAEETMR